MRSISRMGHADKTRRVGTLGMMVGLALALQACGGHGGDGTSLASFVGTWQAVSGTSTTTCPGYQPATDAVTGNVVWSRGTSDDLLQATGTCIINANVEGATADGSGPPCNLTDSDGNPFTLTMTAYTFVVGADGRTATENASGSIASSSITCGVTETASYRKIGD
jgi:hypothetical protein